MDFTTSRALQQKAQRLIPGGASTYAKGDEQYPNMASGCIAHLACVGERLPAGLAERKESQHFHALLLQELNKGGVIAPSLVVSYSHSDVDIDRTVAVCERVLGVYRRTLAEGIGHYLVGGPTKSVYRAY